ncbi:PRD domain-containing protein [Streptococcus infantis]|uniref:PRD domain protein n=1 Tax=Streptococcus infantis ATCC 700779 TaxID=889204 RepID=E8K0A0_9STRE|nr:transcription antiterminator [Streptococcus infantis]EFX36679.1 PRD domain protein [Streptococcus infantis ATCC 700779]EIG39416.1 PRD domain protein [Streptococcus infantis ATCC 700779]SUN81999.1 transcription antiterminator LacT [Streptococcus infantis]
MYRILNPMNNNVSLVRNSKGEELIVVGKGISFGKKKGDLISEDQVEKVFRMKTEESRENFMTLLKDVPLDFITVTYEIIDNLSKKYQYPVQEYLYVTLTDHIYCSYQAISQGRYKDSNLPDISTKYPTAFRIANEAFEIYRQKLTENLPEDEIIRIAYHFINAEGVNEVEVVESIDKRKEILKSVENVLRSYDIQRTPDNNNFYDRFMIHLNYFLDYLDRTRDDNQSLLDMEEHIKTTYPKAFEIGSNIYEVIAQETGVDLYKSERVYLVLHIQRLLS